LVRDYDGAHGEAFLQRVRTMGIRVARIRRDEVRRREAVARRHRAIEQSCDVLLACRIHRDRLCAAARRHNCLGDFVDLGRRPPGDENVTAALRKSPAQRCAEPTFGSDAHNDCGRFAHLLLAWDVGSRLPSRASAPMMARHRWPHISAESEVLQPARPRACSPVVDRPPGGKVGKDGIDSHARSCD